MKFEDTYEIYKKTRLHQDVADCEGNLELLAVRAFFAGCLSGSSVMGHRVASTPRDDRMIENLVKTLKDTNREIGQLNITLRQTEGNG